MNYTRFHRILHFGQKIYGRVPLLPKLIYWFMRTIYCCDIPLNGNIDKTAYFMHNGFGIVVNPTAKIGGCLDTQ